jgi:hypothetical protein
MTGERDEPRRALPKGAGWSPFMGAPARYKVIGRAPVAALIAAIALALPAAIALAERGQGGASSLPGWAPFAMTPAALALLGWGFAWVARRHPGAVRRYYLLCCLLPLLLLAAGWWEFVAG